MASTPAELLSAFAVSEPVEAAADSVPFGTAWLPDEGLGIDLAAHGYVEHEYLITGRAASWEWDPNFHLREVGVPEFVTRLVVRRPLDPARFSGGVHLEPHHHRSNDRALSWSALGPWIVRGGHAHVGFTHEPLMVELLGEWDPARYGRLSVADHTNRWDITGQVAVAIRSGLIPDFAELSADRIVLSGWSLTGTFCRTFLGEGFHERWTHADAPAISGYVVCISSGAAVYRGYDTMIGHVVLPADSPRRTLRARGVPIIELQTEAEAETNLAVLRDDADSEADRYRYYQFAGTGHHIEGDRPSLNTNDIQRTRRIGARPEVKTYEPQPDSRMDLVARAVFEMMDRWITEGLAPPRDTPRFTWGEVDDPGHRGLMEEALPLLRDADGNVVGGIRPPWIELPTGTYQPHSTPDLPDRHPTVRPVVRPPFPKDSDAYLMADLYPCLLAFPIEVLRTRYGSRSHYERAFAARVREFVRQGWMLAEDAQELLETKWAALPEF